MSVRIVALEAVAEQMAVMEIVDLMDRGDAPMGVLATKVQDTVEPMYTVSQVHQSSIYIRMTMNAVSFYLSVPVDMLISASELRRAISRFD